MPPREGSSRVALANPSSPFLAHQTMLTHSTDDEDAASTSCASVLPDCAALGTSASTPVSPESPSSEDSPITKKPPTGISTSFLVKHQETTTSASTMNTVVVDSSRSSLPVAEAMAVMVTGERESRRALSSLLRPETPLYSLSWSLRLDRRGQGWPLSCWYPSPPRSSAAPNLPRIPMSRGNPENPFVRDTSSCTLGDYSDVSANTWWDSWMRLGRIIDSAWAGSSSWRLLGTAEASSLPSWSPSGGDASSVTHCFLVPLEGSPVLMAEPTGAATEEETACLVWHPGRIQGRVQITWFDHVQPQPQRQQKPQPNHHDNHDDDHEEGADAEGVGSQHSSTPHQTMPASWTCCETVPSTMTASHGQTWQRSTEVNAASALDPPRRRCSLQKGAAALPSSDVIIRMELLGHLARSGWTRCVPLSLPTAACSSLEPPPPPPSDQEPRRPGSSTWLPFWPKGPRNRNQASAIADPLTRALFLSRPRNSLAGTQVSVASMELSGTDRIVWRILDTSTQEGDSSPASSSPLLEIRTLEAFVQAVQAGWPSYGKAMVQHSTMIYKSSSLPSAGSTPQGTTREESTVGQRVVVVEAQLPGHPWLADGSSQILKARQFLCLIMERMMQAGWALSCALDGAPSAHQPKPNGRHSTFYWVARRPSPTPSSGEPAFSSSGHTRLVQNHQEDPTFQTILLHCTKEEDGDQVTHKEGRDEEEGAGPSSAPDPESYQATAPVMTSVPFQPCFVACMTLHDEDRLSLIRMPQTVIDGIIEKFEHHAVWPLKTGESSGGRSGLWKRVDAHVVTFTLPHAPWKARPWSASSESDQAPSSPTAMAGLVTTLVSGILQAGGEWLCAAQAVQHSHTLMLAEDWCETGDAYFFLFRGS